MSSNKKDLYFYFNHPEQYRFNVSLLCLNRRRGFKNMPCADLIATSYREYDPSYPEVLLILTEWNAACSYFIKNYNIAAKDDIAYLVCHPEYTDSPKENVCTPYKKIRFNMENEDHKSAYEWLNDFKPRERIDEVLKVVRQYLILNSDEFYIEQEALQIMKSLQEINKGSDILLDKTKNEVNKVWEIGGYRGLSTK